MTKKRKSITKKLRFEIFKRDAFTCQYCGRKAPDIILQIDHLIPVSKGGANDILNLITSCFDCNAGKSNRVLSESTVLKKRQKQLKHLQLKQEQLRMLFEWQEELLKLDDIKLEKLSNYWNILTNLTLTDYGISELKKLIIRYDVNQIMDIMKISVAQYLKRDIEKNQYTLESTDKAFVYVKKILNFRKINEGKPYLLDILYIKGIIKNKYPNQCLNGLVSFLEDCYKKNISIEDMKRLSCESYSYSNFIKELENKLN